MKNKLSITIIMPQAASTKIDNDLVKLTEHLVTNNLVPGTGTYGALGGQYGYGDDFENGIFMMHQFCWCGKSDCPWCLECYCELPSKEEDFRVTLECDNCKHPKEPLPNFWYKPTDLRVHWYKWIGRSMEFNGRPDMKTWKQIMKHCYESLKGQEANPRIDR